MLHLNTISPVVHEILLKISATGFLDGFALAGGTSLALQIGHRKSIDIYLFAFEKPDMKELSMQLENSFEEVVIRKTTPAFIFCYIKNVKTDFVNHSNHLLVKPLEMIEGIRFFSKEDIAAMKLNAICGRGSKKDFYDLYSLFQSFSLKEMLDFYDYKFRSDNSWMALKSLQYFDDADTEDAPALIADFPKWKEIKQFIRSKVNEYQFNA
jgi:predicted nucleotidyltransferase component of viral defense system